MKPILIIDPGHGGKDPGGGSNAKWLEKSLTLAISLYQYERFQELGIPVAITRKMDVTLTPKERTRIVRDSGAAYCFSNHINAGGGDGAEVIHSIYGGKQLAVSVANELKKYGQNIRRVFTRDYPGNPRLDYYFMHRDTGAVVTSIIEYGFADSKQDDIPQLDQNWKSYAEAVVKAFCSHEDFSYDKPKTVQKSKKQFLRLPKAALSWRIYPVGAVPVKGNERGFLRPAKFGGLTYEILGSPQAHVYWINTRDFGKVQIYAHPDTGAEITIA